MNEAVEILAGYRRRMAVRLAVAGMLASLLAGVAAFFIETERLDETLVDQAAIEAHNLGPMVPPTAGREEADAILRDFLVTHAATNRDFFVVAELYDNARKGIGEAALPDFSYVEDSFDRRDHQFPAPGTTWYKKTVIRGAPFLQVMVPLQGRDESPQGWFEGIYRLSPATQDGIRTDIIQITALMVGAVVLTAPYPAPADGEPPGACSEDGAGSSAGEYRHPEGAGQRHCQARQRHQCPQLQGNGLRGPHRRGDGPFRWRDPEPDQGLVPA